VAERPRLQELAKKVCDNFMHLESKFKPFLLPIIKINCHKAMSYNGLRNGRWLLRGILISRKAIFGFSVWESYYGKREILGGLAHLLNKELIISHLLVRSVSC